MPAVSKAQHGLMGAAAFGKRTKADISPEEAKEFIKGQSPKRLPERVKKKKSKSRTKGRRLKSKRSKPTIGGHGGGQVGRGAAGRVDRSKGRCRPKS